MPLIIKRGGHADQLSKAPGLDRYRILSLSKIIASKTLSEDQINAASKVLKEKAAIYTQGCLQRGKKEEALFYMRLTECFGANNITPPRGR